MKKRLAAIAILLALSLTVTALASGVTPRQTTLDATTGVTVLLDGQTLDYTYPDGTKPDPFLVGGVTYLPVRAIAEALGLDVGWEQETLTVTLDSGASAGSTQTASVTVPQNKQELLNVLNASRSYYYDDYLLYEEADMMEVPMAEAPMTMPGEAVMEAPAMAEAEPSAQMAGNEAAQDVDYSGTNVQVEGIDEGDIVKTDGEYIYILREYDLVILKAEGEGTQVVCHTMLGDGAVEEDQPGYDYYYRYYDRMPSEMYVSGDRLAVVSYTNDYLDYEDPKDGWHWEDDTYQTVEIYDISDKTAPKLLSTLGQDGYDIASRLYGDTLYLVSQYTIYDWDEDDPCTYLPCVYVDGQAEPMALDRVGILPIVDSTEYLVIGAYDLKTGQMEDQLSLLGSGNDVYMSRDNLYIAGSCWQDSPTRTWRESVYTVTQYSSGSSTQLIRVGLDGSLDADAAGFVPGYLESQFSMDEYEGNLRLVTTSSGSVWREYVDEDYDFTNTVWDSWSQSNALWVLDQDLELVGSVENLAEDEQIYSARFAGDTAYFCTYRNTDPLFAVDLSDPANPVVLSELKITGFSEYLHQWTPELLLGLGKEANPDTGWTEELKLVMFDVSNPLDVFAADAAIVPGEYWSAALYNHKAVLIDSEKNLICFPGSDAFYVYDYDETRGFALRAAIDLDTSWYSDARALYIGDVLYIAGNSAVAMLDLARLRVIGQVELPEELYPEVWRDYYTGSYWVE